ncbi:uncharacterized protein LOC108669096 [Hyalella azteca]|uniref:Uncharacterized protein LOC108669096 n=1 Tax=Hyalella azteca TaxID=294128 RepID=A0A8B7NE36_HYAAZ|nr:uncharacterized protein LOC108669096 [Hyalella azteca]
MRGIRRDKTFKHVFNASSLDRLAVCKKHVKISSLKRSKYLFLRDKKFRSSLLALNNNFFKVSKAMAMQFNHMFIECLDSKSSLSKELEAKHLKELVLLHLDLIQQQAEDLAARDKLIKELKEENKKLRACLDCERNQKISPVKLGVDSVTTKSNNAAEKGLCKENTCANNNNNTRLPTISAISKGIEKNEKQSTSEGGTANNISLLSCRSTQDKIAHHSPETNSSSKHRAVSPSLRILRNSSTLAAQKSCVKIEGFVGKPLSDLSVPIRHSPRLDQVCGSDISPSNDNQENASFNLSQSTNPIKSEVCKSINTNSSAHAAQRRHSKLSLNSRPRSQNSQGISKKSTRSDTSCSEVDSSDGEGLPELGIPLDSKRESSSAGLVASRQHPSTTNAKRKSDGQDIDNTKKQKQTHDGAIVEDYLNQNLHLVGADSLNDLSDGTVRHSLRSRVPANELCGNTTEDLSFKSEVTSVEGRKRLLRHTNPDVFEETNGQVEISPVYSSGINLQEHENVFLKVASEAAAKLKEQNARVPVCSGRAVRSKEGYLTTEEHYFLPTEPPMDLTDPTEASLSMETDLPPLNKLVEIPRWKVSVLTPLYVMEGTENLEDEIFSKRHHKLEQDEKRRKRWDLQRLREQRQYEKLRERYEVRNSAVPSTSADPESSCATGTLCHLHSGAACSSTTSCTGSKLSGTKGGGGAGGVCIGASVGSGAGGSIAEVGSLWPEPCSAMFLEVTDKVPVCAFGQPCAVLPPVEFSLPWLTGGQLENTLVRRKRR